MSSLLAMQIPLDKLMFIWYYILQVHLSLVPDPFPRNHAGLPITTKIALFLCNLSTSESTLTKVYQNKRLYLPVESTLDEKQGEGGRLRSMFKALLAGLRQWSSLLLFQPKLPDRPPTPG
jgi:hypothetical protein